MEQPDDSLFGCDKVLRSYCIVEPLSLVSATKVPDSKILWYGSRDSLADPLYSFHLPSQSQPRHRPSESIRSTIAAKASSQARALMFQPITAAFEKPSLHQFPQSRMPPASSSDLVLLE